MAYKGELGIVMVTTPIHCISPASASTIAKI